MSNKFLTTQSSITSWLDKYGIDKYSLVPDSKYGFKVNVKGSVLLSNKNLSFIPVKFNEVRDEFNCCMNKLDSLEFCPEKVTNFFCGGNKITSLQFSPQSIEHFYCEENKLTSLEFCPQTIRGDFNCSRNKLTSLKFAPSSIGMSFFCRGNNLTTLEHCPTNIGNEFNCSNNNLKSLKFCPDIVADEFNCSRNNLNSLEYCPSTVGGVFFCYDNKKLGDIQNIEDFKEIYKLHQELLITKAYNKLDSTLTHKPSHPGKIKI